MRFKRDFCILRVNFLRFARQATPGSSAQMRKYAEPRDQFSNADMRFYRRFVFGNSARYGRSEIPRDNGRKIQYDG